jgi:predicted DNA-binding transcriptional regulator AlpA
MVHKPCATARAAHPCTPQWFQRSCTIDLCRARAKDAAKDVWTLLSASIEKVEGGAHGTSGRGHYDPETESLTMYEPTYLTQDEAAAVCNKSKDTIWRYCRKGHLPNSRPRPVDTVEVAVGDLVAANLVDPLLATDGVSAMADRAGAERDFVMVRPLRTRCGSCLTRSRPRIGAPRTSSNLDECGGRLEREARLE